MASQPNPSLQETNKVGRAARLAPIAVVGQILAPRRIGVGRGDHIQQRRAASRADRLSTPTDPSRRACPLVRSIGDLGRRLSHLYQTPGSKGSPRKPGGTRHRRKRFDRSDSGGTSTGVDENALSSRALSPVECDSTLTAQPWISSGVFGVSPFFYNELVYLVGVDSGSK